MLSNQITAMSSGNSRETSVVEFGGDDAPKASNSQAGLDSHVDTPETDPKGSEQDQDQEDQDSQDDGDNDDDKEGNQEEEEENVEGDKTGRTDANSTQETVQVSNSAASAIAGDWQAIWSPQHNAYYFYNPRTQETTWINPIQPQPGSNTSNEASSSSSSTAALYAAAEAAGIDPSLAHLDPTLIAPGATPSGAFAAKFNSRTGAFTRVDGRDPSFLSEAERVKRMSSVYFDVNAWEAELEQRYEEESMNGKKRKRPTKKDLERFKEQKRMKKIAKTAWLRT